MRDRGGGGSPPSPDSAAAFSASAAAVSFPSPSDDAEEASAAAALILSGTCKREAPLPPAASMATTGGGAWFGVVWRFSGEVFCGGHIHTVVSFNHGLAYMGVLVPGKLRPDCQPVVFSCVCCCGGGHVAMVVFVLGKR